jgi:hypothetical protein
MSNRDDHQLGRALLRSLRESPAETPADLAADAATRALSTSRPSDAEGFLDVLIPLGWRAAALGAVGAAVLALVVMRAPLLVDNSATRNPMTVWWNGTASVFQPDLQLVATPSRGMP